VHDALLMILSIVVWLTLLVAVLRSFAAAAAGVLVTVAGLLLGRAADLPFSGPDHRALLWGSLILAALLSLASHSRGPERNKAAFTLLTAAILLVAALTEPAVDGLLGLVLAIAASIVVAGLTTWVGRRSRGAGRDRRLRTALRSLQHRTELDRKKLAHEVLQLLEDSASGRVSAAEIGQATSIPWEEAWILARVLGYQDGLMFESENSISPRASLLLVTDSGRLGEVEEDLRLPSSTQIENIVFNVGGDVATGDTYHVTGTNVTGAFGRNKVRDIASTATGGQAQSVTQELIVAEARRVAKELDGAKADELNEAAHDIEAARDGSVLRRAVERVLGIAVVLGEHGGTLLDMAKKFLLGGDG
jgi:hypothetical protein